MEESTKQKVLEIIRKAIDEVVYDEMKQMPERLKFKQEEIKVSRAQREQQVHDDLFGKKEDDWTYKLNLHEAEKKPTITSSELSNFEKDFKQHFPGIYFEKQIGVGKSGQIVDFPQRNGENDAISSGKIVVGQESIGFNMSLLNGVEVFSLKNGSEILPFELKANASTEI